MDNNNAEPPSCAKPPLFMIGQDGRGNWVVQDQSGIRGGLFVDRAEALRYARFENGNRSPAVDAAVGSPIAAAILEPTASFAVHSGPGARWAYLAVVAECL